MKIKEVVEKAPPGREKQVKKLKKKFDDPGAPYAIAWAQHNKHGKRHLLIERHNASENLSASAQKNHLNRVSRTNVG